MNILLTSFLKPDAPSGVRVHYLALAAQLRRRGHQVDVVTPATLTGPRRHAIAALRHLLLRLGPAPRALATNVAYFLHILWGIDRRRPYDVVNAQDPGSGLAARWAWASACRWWSRATATSTRLPRNCASSRSRERRRGPCAAGTTTCWPAPDTS